MRILIGMYEAEPAEIKVPNNEKLSDYSCKDWACGVQGQIPYFIKIL